MPKYLATSPGNRTFQVSSPSCDVLVGGGAEAGIFPDYVFCVKEYFGVTNS